MRSTECRFSFFVLSVPYRLAAAPRDQTYEEALKEMMERIKSGRALKSTANEVRLYVCVIDCPVLNRKLYSCFCYRCCVHYATL